MTELTPMMTTDEARTCIERIRTGLEDLRRLVLDLNEREGWRALGYKSWRECVTAEFGQSQAYLYRTLTAAKIERELSPMGEIGALPERHVRELVRIKDPDVRREVWEEVRAEHGDQVTAEAIRAAVERRAATPMPKPEPSPNVEVIEVPAVEQPPAPKPGSGSAAWPPKPRPGQASFPCQDCGEPQRFPTHHCQNCSTHISIDDPRCEDCIHIHQWQAVKAEITALPDLDDDERAVESNGAVNLFQSIYRVWDTYRAIPRLARYIEPLERVMEGLRDDIREAMQG
jgi:hypothetical protein